MYMRDAKFLSSLSRTQITYGMTCSMDVGHIILGRSWLFDLDVTIYERTNQCSFVHNDKVKLISNQSKPPISEKKVDKAKEKWMY